MKQILLLIVALSLASAQSPPTVTAPAPVLGVCTELDLIQFAFTLPNLGECGLAFGTVFTPSTVNNSMSLNQALESLCTTDCGGRYAEFLETTCEDATTAGIIGMYCTRTNGSSALGEFCRYSAADVADRALLEDLNACDNVNVTCSPACRRALNRVRDQLGCCYQLFYNNTEYIEGLIGSELITLAEYLRLQRLGNTTSNPWMTCNVRPPRRCLAQPFVPRPPTPTVPTSICTENDVIEFVTGLPNPQQCGLALSNVFDPAVFNNVMVLNEAVENLCMRDCGGRYSEFLETTCDDQVSSETIRIYCTRADGSSSLGEYCRYSAGDIADPALLNDLYSCSNFTSNITCTRECRRALNRVREELGCCYQELYNNTNYLEGLTTAGFLSEAEILGLSLLNDPTIGPWTVCGIRPPRRCEGRPFGPDPEPEVCTDEDRRDFVSALPNAAECGFGLFNIFGPPANDSTALPSAIDSVCNNECGGVYSNFLENECRADLEAEVLRVYCTPTNGTANVGSHCRYAIGDLIDISLLTDLFACSNNSDQQPCVPGCRSALERLSEELGCCYQNAYNDTRFNNVLLNSGVIDLTEYVLRLSLGNPDGNPWTQCDITPPSSCKPPQFDPPEPLCTDSDIVEYFTQLPNAEECGAGLSTAFVPSNNTAELTAALESVCTRECGGRYSNFLRTECNQQFTSETLRIYCTPSDGTAAAGDYCRFAAGDILDTRLLNDLDRCNHTEDRPCSFECRRVLLRLRNEVGCCYQDLYNNTFYYTQLLSQGFITHTEFLHFTELNHPDYSVWDACNVTAPQRCRGDPFPRDMGCPTGAYRTRDRMCRPCPANTDLSQSGGDATMCPCLRGYFRAENEGPSERCSAPPDACRDIQVRRRGSENITLSWSRPRNAGRDDFFYIVEYTDRFTSSLYPVTDRGNRVEDIVGGLRPDTEYTFTVTVHNGVSAQDERNERLRQCKLTTSTSEGVPSPPTDVTTFCFVVTWRFPRNPNGRILHYEVELMAAGSNEVSIHETRADGTFLAIPKDYQIFGTYVRVRARTVAGSGAWSPGDILRCDIEDTSEPTCPPCNCPSTDPPTQAGVYFTLGDVVYPNNSVAFLDNVGEGDEALICRTDNTDCCGTVPNRFGEFYYPGGRLVPVSRAGEPFYRNRGDSLIRLNHRGSGTAGTFRCEIPDAAGVTTNIYITLEA